MILRLRPTQDYYVSKINNGYTNMTTRKRRLQVTIEPELEPVLLRLSQYMGIPQSTIVTNLLMESLPVLKQTADALELASKGQLDLNGLMGMVQQSISDAQALESELLDQQKGQ